MSTTLSVGPRPTPRPPLLALGVVLAGLLAPIAGGATAQSTPVTGTRAEVALLERPARLHVQNVSLADALGELERRSGVPLAFSPSLLPASASLNCACDTATTGEALQRLLADVPFTFREADGQIIVVPARETARAEPATPPSSGLMPPPETTGAFGLVMPAPTPVKADSATVTGRVTS